MIRFVFSKSLRDILTKIKTSIVHLKMINEEYFRTILLTRLSLPIGRLTFVNYILSE